MLHRASYICTIPWLLHPYALSKSFKANTSTARRPRCFLPHGPESTTSRCSYGNNDPCNNGRRAHNMSSCSSDCRNDEHCALRTHGLAVASRHSICSKIATLSSEISLDSHAAAGETKHNVASMRTFTPILESQRALCVWWVPKFLRLYCSASCNRAMMRFASTKSSDPIPAWTSEPRQRAAK